MPDWIEKMSGPQASAKRRLPLIPLTWEVTTVPETPVSLPIGVTSNVVEGAIQLHAERKDSFYDEEANLQLQEDEILGIDIILMPELPDDTDMQYVTVRDLSRAIIRHRDPFEVVPFFESTFTAVNPYWLKALVKAIKERLGVELSVTQTDTDA
jgi:hypothetical protein